MNMVLLSYFVLKGYLGGLEYGTDPKICLSLKLIHRGIIESMRVELSFVKLKLIF